MNRIIPFLIRAKRAAYAGDGDRVPSSRPASKDIPYREGNLLYYDTYLGGDAFIGEEAVWVDDIPCWAMNYYGRRLDSAFNYDFLKEALRHIPPEMPVRGPARYQNGNYVYFCTVNGSLEWFQGCEEIFSLDRKIYMGVFHGGMVK